MYHVCVRTEEYFELTWIPISNQFDNTVEQYFNYKFYRLHVHLVASLLVLLVVALEFGSCRVSGAVGHALVLIYEDAVLFYGDLLFQGHAVVL